MQMPTDIVLVLMPSTGNEAMHANAVLAFISLINSNCICKFFTHFTPNFPMKPRVCQALNHPAIYVAHVGNSTQFASSISASTSKLWDVLSPSHLWSAWPKHIIYILHICIECSISQRSCAHTCLWSKYEISHTNAVCMCMLLGLCCIVLYLN